MKELTFPTTVIIMPESLSSEVVTSAAVHCKKPIIHIPHTGKFTGTDTTLLEYITGITAYHK